MPPLWLATMLVPEAANLDFFFFFLYLLEQQLGLWLSCMCHCSFAWDFQIHWLQKHRQAAFRSNKSQK